MKGQPQGVPARGPHLADQRTELCWGQVSEDPTEDGDCNDHITQDAAQVVEGVDTNCRGQNGSEGEGMRPVEASLASLSSTHMEGD